MTSTTVNAQDLRRVVLAQSKRANVGHIGSALCVADIIAVLYGTVLRLEGREVERDRFVLSKGHAALALYAALALRGLVSRAELETFCGDDSRLGVHPEHTLPGVDFCTGSLGHGLSMAVGAALAARLQESKRRVYCLLSDAECNEGSVWEAAMFAAHHRLDALTAIVDVNGQQAFGATAEVLDQENAAERWRAFGWEVVEVDGHDARALTASLQRVTDARRPRVLLAQTQFGKGVSFMEQGIPVSQKHLPVQRINWHYLPLSDEEYALAMAEMEPTA
jgi:transketolase